MQSSRSRCTAVIAAVLALSPLACGPEAGPGEQAARGACRGLTEDDVRPEADRINFLKDKEQLAAQAANEDPRYDALYDARKALREATEKKDSKGALAAGLLVVRECREVNAD
ncbi:MAG: hypothetical protein ACRDZ3_01795 [Acidimicrobiia bacterium]